MCRLVNNISPEMARDYLTVILQTGIEYELIADEREWNNCFIIYTRSEFTHFAFQIFSIFFYFVYVLSSLFRPIIIFKYVF